MHIVHERNEMRWRGKARRQIRIQRDFRGFKREIEKFPLCSSRIRVVIIVSRWRGCEYIWLHNSSISLHTFAHVLRRYANWFSISSVRSRETYLHSRAGIMNLNISTAITYLYLSYLYLSLYIFYTMRYCTLRKVCIETSVSF